MKNSVLARCGELVHRFYTVENFGCGKTKTNRKKIPCIHVSLKSFFLFTCVKCIWLLVVATIDSDGVLVGARKKIDCTLVQTQPLDYTAY
jgi:hypothetical protein